MGKPYIAMCALSVIKPGECFSLDDSMYLVTQMEDSAKDTRTVVAIYDGRLLSMRKYKVVTPMDCIVEASRKAM